MEKMKKNILFLIILVFMVFKVQANVVMPSYNICFNVSDFSKNESLNDFSLFTNYSGDIVNSTDEWYYNRFKKSYQFEIKGLPEADIDSLRFFLKVEKNNYLNSELLYIENISSFASKEDKCFINHTFYLKPINENKSQDNLTSTNSSDVLDDSTDISEKSNVMVIIIVSLVFLLLGVFSYFKLRKKFY